MLTFPESTYLVTSVDKSIQADDVTYVVYERGGGKDDDNIVTLTDCQITPGFTKNRHPVP